MRARYSATGIAAPKRVLMTADALGGVWSYVIGLARALQEHDAAVALATMGAPLSEVQRKEIAHCSNVSVFESDYRLEWMSEPWRDVGRAGRWLLDIERTFKPEIVHLNGYAHAQLPWRAPTVLVAHSCVLSWWLAVKDEEAPSSWDQYRATVAAGLNAARAVVAPTEAMLSSLRRCYRWYGSGIVIPNGCTDALLIPAAKQPFILCAGRLWDQAKNLDLIRRAAPRCPWPIFAAGEYRHPEGGKACAENICLLGRLEPKSLARWMSSAAIFVAPAKYEPFGLGILEAGRSGCALILGDIPSLRELWTGAARFVSTDDPDQLVQTIDELARESERREILGRLARQRALKFSRTRMLDRYLSLYDQILHRCSAARTEAVACK